MRLTDALRGLAGRAVDRERARRYDAGQNREAEAARARIEAQHPEARLGPAIHRRARDYAGDVLGSVSFAPWLRTYATWRREFREGWIPDNYFGRVVLPALPGTKGLRVLGSNKTLARRLLGTDLLPDRASWVSGAWLDAAGDPSDEATAIRAIFADGEVAVLKHEGAGRGIGVSTIRRGEFRPAEHTSRGDFVVQAWIRQAPFFDAFTTASVATLRLTTSKVGGTPANLRCAYLRLGLAGSEVLIAPRSVRVPIADGVGHLAPLGALPDWTSVTSHPDSGTPFAGARVPRFEDAVAAVLALHDRVPHVAHVGWDMTVDDEGRLRLMEWNPGHADIKFSEAANGPHFADLGWERLGRGAAGAGR